MTQRSFRSRLNPGRLTRSMVAGALLAAMAGATSAQPADAPGPGAGPRMGGMHRMAPGMHGDMPAMGQMAERELDAVGASAEQKTRVREIMRSAHDELRKQHEASRELHLQLQQALGAAQVDAAAAEALRQKLSAQHDAASKRMLQAALDAGAVLTPEQRQKLAERRKQRQDMMQRHQKEREALRPPRS